VCRRIVETCLYVMYGWRVQFRREYLRVCACCGVVWWQLMGRLERRVALLYMEVAAIAYPAHNYDVRHHTWAQGLETPPYSRTQC
jgi:hypothetical protein